MLPASKAAAVLLLPGTRTYYLIWGEIYLVSCPLPLTRWCTHEGTGQIQRRRIKSTVNPTDYLCCARRGLGRFPGHQEHGGLQHYSCPHLLPLMIVHRPRPDRTAARLPQQRALA